MAPDREPTQDELQAMAYADGELSETERRQFEARLADSPGLGKEVSEYLSLAILARQLAPPEPMDHEWDRLSKDPVQRMGFGAGWLLLLAGAFGVGGLGIYDIAQSDMAMLEKTFALALIGGVLVLLLVTLRGRLRTLPYDPYEKVQR
jgi:anti-sigma factor RsiW